MSPTVRARVTAALERAGVARGKAARRLGLTPAVISQAFPKSGEPQSRVVRDLPIICAELGMPYAYADLPPGHERLLEALDRVPPAMVETFVSAVVALANGYALAAGTAVVPPPARDSDQSTPPVADPPPNP